MKNFKIWKYSGLFLVFTGILHIFFALLSGGAIYMEIIRDGLFNALGYDYSRQFAFWFLVCGLLIVLFGQTLHCYQKREQKPAPLYLGYGMLIFSIFGCIVVPMSGFWLFIPQALIIIIANMKKKNKHQAAGTLGSSK